MEILYKNDNIAPLDLQIHLSIDYLPCESFQEHDKKKTQTDIRVESNMLPSSQNI